MKDNNVNVKNNEDTNAHSEVFTGIPPKIRGRFSGQCMNKGIAGKSLWKITYSTLLIFIHPCCCHPELVEGSIEWIVALREPQCDSTFNYYVYSLFFVFIYPIFCEFI